ncbi:hypothetical protein [Acinetobacter baumannii]|uniref:hypothetical protein n=1 Tax=Acinetobacter baumannii TaxID=470 RepID=UPI000E09DAFA|nr:hypothetical protein [Acinetobacter baumannii]RDF73039.1 hypothetical protein DWA08_17440 [Acinetobacter baumannii]TDI14941.1 hypothetical protein DWA21_24710 [Acinetobacter baumannii]
MIDLNQELEDFDAYFFKRHGELPLDPTSEEYANKSYLKHEMFKAWKKAKAQVVLDTQQKLTDTYYLEGSDYVVDCPFEYDIEIDKGEVLELQKWQRTESTKVYFANIYKDEDNFEILQFASKAEAENAVAENLKFLEASESGAEG